MMRKVKMDCHDGERIDPNGSRGDMEQCNRQLICWIKGLKSHLGRLKSSYKPTYAKRERKISSTPSYLIIWVTPLTIKHSLIRTKSSYIHGSFNHFIVKYRPTQRFQMPTVKFSKPEFGPSDKTRDWPDTTRNQRDSNWKIRLDSRGQFRVIFSPTRLIQVQTWPIDSPTYKLDFQNKNYI